MKHFSYGIGLFCIIFLLVFGFYTSYQASARQTREQPETMEAENPMASGYHIKISGEKIIVELDDGSIYETTDISWETLPASVQNRIMDGYVLKSKQELYSFLENFSS